MRRYLAALLLVIASASVVFAQTDAKSNGIAAAPAGTIPPPPPITPETSPVDLAKAALAAQGGEKFRNLKSTWLVGSADLYAPNSSQALPGKFSLVTAGEKIRIDINAQPVFNFKQIYDGVQSYSSIPGVQMPPANKFGLAVLAKHDQPGYTVSALPNDKKLRGFRISDAEGNTTDFYIDPVTARVMKYLISFEGHLFGTENSKFKEFDGVLIPMNFTQRLEMAQGAFFAEYKVKDVKLNTPISDDVFAIQ